MIDPRYLAFMSFYKHRNRKKAAEELFISPPAAGKRLDELEKLLDKRLFERDSSQNSGYKPTIFADSLFQAITSARDVYDASLKLPDNDIKNNEGSPQEFNIAMSEWAEFLLAPELLRRLRNINANYELRISTLHNDLINRVQDVSWLNKELNEGRIDCAVHYAPPSFQPGKLTGLLDEEQLDDGVYSKILGSEDMVGIVNADHPTIRSKITYEQYLDMEHVLIDETMIDRFLKEGDVRKMAIKASSLSVLPVYISQNVNFMSSPPRRLAKMQASHYNIKLVELPDEISSPSIDLRIAWHKSKHEDPSHYWMRSLIYDTFQSL